MLGLILFSVVSNELYISILVTK